MTTANSVFSFLSILLVISAVFFIAWLIPMILIIGHNVRASR